jgi:hypothetical protein
MISQTFAAGASISMVLVNFALTGPWALTMPENNKKAAETNSEVFFITFPMVDS